MFEFEHNHQVYRAVSQIPYGRVITYGRIAEMAGMHGMAREVGHALFSIPQDSELPWHRVVNAKGEISARSMPMAEKEQRLRLEKEGVVFDSQNRISLKTYGWNLKESYDSETQASLW